MSKWLADPRFSDEPAPMSFRMVMSILTIGIASVFLFARLGHYALWDDEAITALTAKGVLKTGDTSAILDHNNLLVYRNGLLLRDMKDRATPPLQFYLVAPFLAALGENALAARLPFALCGLACIALILWWLHREEASPATWLLMCVAIAGNVSLFLFFRQARYYGLATVLAVAIAHSYLHNRTRAGLIWHSFLSMLLLAANYMTFAVVSAAMLIDYIIWGRKRRALHFRDWIILIVPQMIFGAIILSIWNPLRIAADESIPGSWLKWKATLLWWNLRDLNSCEFGVGAFLLAAPLIWLATRSSWLLRAMLAFVIGIVLVTLISPQGMSNTKVADVRYLSFMIPLCIAMGVLVLQPIARIGAPLAVIIAIVGFTSNMFHGTPIFEQDMRMRSTLALWIRELKHPPPEPITPTAQWINTNVKPGQSVLVMPAHMTYPLMFHAPRALYAWQLDDPIPQGLENLPQIHYFRRIWPDYVVIFAPEFYKIPTESREYELATRIDVLGKESYRPELFWRVFGPVEFDPRENGIFILKRVVPGLDFRL